MANREKKLSLGRKQASASPVPSKETATATTDIAPKCNQKTEITQMDDSSGMVKSASSVTKNVPAITKKILKPVTKKIIKRNISAVKMKAKSRRPIKIKQQLAKTLLNNAKNNLENKVLLKNGIKNVRRTNKANVIGVNKSKAAPKVEDKNNDKPPTLEQMSPDEEIVIKRPKKKYTKKIIIIDDATKNKSASLINETIEDIINQSRTAFDNPSVKQKRPRKKLKAETESTNETLEAVMNDLSHLIEQEGDKKDISTEPEKGDNTEKPQKAMSKTLFKKENLENSLDPAANKVIDMLDLNIKQVKNKKIQQRRRHSIEKFPIGLLENIDVPSISQLFSNVPRSISPRSKRALKTRLSSDNLSKRSSPYTTRSDSPARILRNGKHRKLKNRNLLDGLDSEYKKRRRLCSDYSGSEKSVSKLSGYESDSSFSDLASMHGIESIDQKDDIGKEQENIDDANKVPAVIKRSLSVGANGIVEQNFTDTNSNLCTDIKPLNVNIRPEISEELDETLEETIKSIVKAESEKIDYKESIIVDAVSKVPDKSIILDIMKQTFNDIPLDEQDKRPTRSCVKKLLKESNSKPECKQEKTDNVEIHSDETLSNGTAINEVNSCKSKDCDMVENKNFPDSKISETPEDLALKENVLLALGLRSLKAAEEEKLKVKEKFVPSKSDNSYTGTLKTVIKIGRNEKKKSGRNSLKMTLQKNKGKISGEAECSGMGGERSYKIMKEGGTSNGKSHGAQSSDTAGAHRKSHYSNRSNMDGSSEHTSDGDTVDGQSEGKSLVIPEKASSFSIHPGRLCKDECSHCFGKFGLFDTPCHIAQMKSVERQDKILASEKHLTRDSCLCDACYRHVDRKSNTPSYTNKSSFKRSNLVAPGPRQNHCHVLGCSRVASNILRRKWIIKMRKSVCQVINIDLDNPGLHSIPICDEHYAALEHLMVCAMCKRRLARNHIHYLGPESSDLNNILNKEGIPVTLTDKPVVCKLCRYFATLVLKAPEERPDNSKSFFDEYKKRLLHFHDVQVMDDSAAEEPIPVPTKEKVEKEQVKKKKKTSKCSDPPVLEPQLEVEKSDQSRVPSEFNSQSGPESPSDYMVDYNTLIPNIALECGSDVETSKNDSSKKSVVLTKVHKPESVKEAVEISKHLKLKSKSTSDITVQKLGSNPSISVRQLFPGEEDLQLHANVDFSNVVERTPEGWERCTSIVQYDLETKHLWQDLQKPYGNQSSFLRHLILLEKYFRCGDLVLSPNASHHSRNYSESVHNRLRAYDNVPTTLGQISLLPINKQQKSSSGIITSKDTAPTFALLNAANIPKNTPITISQLNNTNFNSNGSTQKLKNPGVPPGLISINQGAATKPIATAPLVKVQQKFKFPISKNWRPNLIPIDPNKKPEKKSGLVKVISGGKPYHITFEDYRKMCELKRNYERQKKLETHSNKVNIPAGSSILKTLAPRKDLTISKTSTITSPNNDQPLQDMSEIENSLEKLEAKFASDKSPMLLPKIPKSLTVIPQTITRKLSRPSSPNLLNAPKPKHNLNNS